MNPLRKHALAINSEFYSVGKTENVIGKNIFPIFLLKTLTLESPRQDGSSEYPQSMFRSKNKENRVPLHTLVVLYKSGVLGGIHFEYYTYMLS